MTNTNTRKVITRIPCRAHNCVILQGDTLSPDGELEAREILMFTPDNPVPTHMMEGSDDTGFIYTKAKI
jgi:hypothetical protein